MKPTIDTNTPITTAARRLTREINRTPALIRLYFDPDTGNTVDAHPADMRHAKGAPAHLIGKVPVNGRRGSRWGRMTERQAQDILDGHASGDPDHHSHMLESARNSEAEKRRLTR